MAERWDRVRVLALAPDAPSQRAAQSLASGRSWPLTGAAEPGVLWGECRGSAAAPYHTVIDLADPAPRRRRRELAGGQYPQDKAAASNPARRTGPARHRGVALVTD